MIYCPQCGNPNFDDANFCDTCGEPLVNPEVYEQIRSQAEAAQYAAAQQQQKQMEAYNKAFRKAQKDAERAAAKNAKAQGASAVGGAGAVGAQGAGAGMAGAVGAQGAGVGVGAVDAQGMGAEGGIPGVTTGGGAPGANNGAVPPGSVPPAGGYAAPGVPGAAAGGGASMPGAGAPGMGAPIPPAVFPVYKHGCVAQAWDDITESDGWGKRIALLGLLNMIPILNFFVTGYAMNWARQLEDDRVEPMPQKIFGDGYFVQGFYAFVIGLVLGIVSTIASTILGIIPILGGLVMFAFAFLLAMFQAFSIMRIAISRELGPAFDIKAIFAAMFKADFGKAFCATIVPGLIVGAAAAFVCGSILVIFAMSTISSMIDLATYAQYGMVSWSAIMTVMLTMIPTLLVCYMVVAFLGAIEIVLTLRATSHFIMRYCGSWTALAHKTIPSMQPVQPVAPAAQPTVVPSATAQPAAAPATTPTSPEVATPATTADQPTDTTTTSSDAPDERANQ